MADSSSCLDHERRLIHLESDSSRGVIQEIQVSLANQATEIACIRTTLSSLKETPQQIAEIRERLAMLEGLKWAVPVVTGIAGSVISSILIR